MPYFVDDSAAGCNGFATVKEDGEVIGCHTTKEAAIAQMVAVSIAEDLEPGGDYNERIDVVTQSCFDNMFVICGINVDDPIYRDQNRTQEEPSNNFRSLEK